MKIRIARGIKTRKHHNTKGSRQIRRGKTAAQVEAMCKRLGLPFRHGPDPIPDHTALAEESHNA